MDGGNCPSPEDLLDAAEGRPRPSVADHLLACGECWLAVEWWQRSAVNVGAEARKA